MPLTKKESEEYNQSKKEYPEQIDFYNQLLKSGNRIVMKYQEIGNPGWLNSELVKSRKDFNIFERFKRKLTDNPITRKDLEIKLQSF